MDSSSISPDRLKSYFEMVRSLPRICSPTICGMLADDQPRAESPTSPEAEWTIDEYALLYGKDFPNTDEIEEFHRLENDLFGSSHVEESERFFSQPIINQSPMVRANRSLPFTESSSRSTLSFIHMLNNISQNQASSDEEDTPINSPDCSMLSVDTSACSPINSTRPDNRFTLEDSDYGTMSELSLTTELSAKLNFTSENCDCDESSKSFDFGLSPILPLSRGKNFHTPNKTPDNPFLDSTLFTTPKVSKVKNGKVLF